ncbi:MAG: hypothetical protein HY906_16590 [Deltaproteobacteria bacterium]|nr:hypothetical protein [Deltaproteobacteria bacterium]
MPPAGLALLLVVAVAGCGSTPPPSQRDAGHDALSDASYWFDAAPQDGPRPRPDVAPIPGLSVTVDGVPWYVLNGSTSYSPALAMSYISAMVSCDACTDYAQFLISLPGDHSEDPWSSHTNECGPSADTINFMRTSISPHAWRSATGGNCGFNISEAGGDESVRVVGSFHGVVTNVDSQVTVTYALGIDFDLALGTSFP